MCKLWRLLAPLATMLVVITMAPPAYAAVSVSRAEVSGTRLRVEGTATANRSITVDGVAMGSSDGSGRFRISRSGYTAPADCTIDVNDGSATPRTATLRGCTVSTPPPTTSPQITPVGAELGPGFVGSDFTTFSTTTTTLTFGPDALGPVHFEVVAGQLPAGLQLVDQNDGSSPNKAVNASIVGTPTTAQTTTFTVRATDANGLTATRTYSITINPARTLEINPQPWAALKVGEFSNLWVDGVGGVRPYTWTRSAGAFPTGMSLIQDNPDGPLVRVSGTPTTAGTFTFTLRLTDAQGTTVTRSFTVTVPEPDTSTAPAAPTHLAPADGASVTTPFTIDWTEEFDPTLSANGGYNWQVSATSTFSTLVLRDSTLPTVTQDTISGIPDGTYFWRVQAVDGQLRSSEFSTPSRFTVAGTSTNQPGTSVLRLPPYGDSFHPFESFELFWTAADRAVKYELLASKDSTFPAGSIKIDNITSTSSGITIGDFCGGCEQGTYFARVVAIDANGNRGLPSNTISFTISYNAPLPPPPGLVSPTNGATVALPVKLDWSEVPNPQPSGYELQISRNSSFTDIEEHAPQLTASERTVLSLTAGTKFWRVRSHQGNASPTTSAVTDWSPARSFTIAGGEVGVQSVWLGGPPCQDPCPGTEFLNSGQEIEVSLQLTGAAPDGGAVVSLSADNPTAAGRFPATVTVPAGVAFTTFRLFAGEVTEPTAVTLTATLGASSDSTGYTVRPPTVKRLSFCCDSTGGLPAAAHLEFTGKVPAGGAVVSLSSDSPLADPPATVTVAAGSFSTGISIPTDEVTTTTTVTISATWNGSTVTAALKLYPQQPPTSLVLDRTETNGTQGASGVVRIATGQDHEVLMRITSSHPGIAKPQPYAQIGRLATAGSFSINTEPPAASTEVTISATGAGVTINTKLTVHPVGGPTGGASISALTLDPTSVTGGDPSTGTVTLSAAAPAGGAVVTLSSGNTAAATVPASVTVPAGGTSAAFTVTSKAVTAEATAQITGVYGGLARGSTLTVRPAAAPTPSINAVSLSPSAVTGGASSTGTVTLTSAAPTGGASVSLSSSNTAAATVPTAVTVPAGATTATFQVTSRTVTGASSSTISGTFGGASRTAVLTVNPAAQTDSVSVQRAEYGSGRLRVEATSTSSTVTLRVSVTSTGAAIGTLTNDGGGRYRGELSWPSNPQNITVTSSGGGSATRSVTLK